VVGRGRRLRVARRPHCRAALARARRAALRVRDGLEPGRFYPRFDAVVLLSAPAEVLLGRIESRTTNDYGKTAEERELILEHLAEVEPLLRATCTHEVDAAQPVDGVVAELILLALEGGGP